MWSYTDARYQPPPPYVPTTDPYEPFALAAVELDGDGLVVLGQMAAGVDRRPTCTSASGSSSSSSTLFDDDEHEYTIWKWRPASMSRRRSIAGVGMTPWGKWGRNFVEYGVEAARDALADAGIEWRDVQFVAGGETVRNGYAGYVAGASIAQALGWTGAQVSTSYGACASGSQALDVARARILAGLCDVALVVGADTTPKGFLAPNAGDRPDDPDWLRFRLLGATNPTYFALMARRRIDLYGATPEDFATVKVKNARHGLANPRARYRKEVTVEEVLDSPVVADPLHLLDICATSDGGAAVVLVSDGQGQQLGVGARRCASGPSRR